MRAKFILSEVTSGLRRNITMTIAMIITTAISLGLLGSGLLMVKMSENTELIYKDKVEIDVYLTEDITVNDPECEGEICKGLRTDLEDTEGVKSVRYVNYEGQLAMVRETTPEEADLFEFLGPSALPASFKLRVPDPDRFAPIAQDFIDRPGVDDIVTQKDVVDQLLAMLKGVRNVAFAVAIVQGLGAILLMANMIQIAAYSRRTEVGVMRLVGASRWFTQLPFLLEAIVAAVIGAGVAVGGLFLANTLFLSDMLTEIGTLGQITNGDIGLMAPVLVGIGAVFAAVTAWVTLRLYVRE